MSFDEIRWVIIRSWVVLSTDTRLFGCPFDPFGYVFDPFGCAFDPFGYPFDSFGYAPWAQAQGKLRSPLR